MPSRCSKTTDSIHEQKNEIVSKEMKTWRNRVKTWPNENVTILHVHVLLIKPMLFKHFWPGHVFAGWPMVTISPRFHFHCLAWVFSNPVCELPDRAQPRPQPRLRPVSRIHDPFPSRGHAPIAWLHRLCNCKHGWAHVLLKLGLTLVAIRRVVIQRAMRDSTIWHLFIVPQLGHIDNNILRHVAAYMAQTQHGTLECSSSAFFALVLPRPSQWHQPLPQRLRGCSSIGGQTPHSRLEIRLLCFGLANLIVSIRILNASSESFVIMSLIRSLILAKTYSSARNYRLAI